MLARYIKDNGLEDDELEASSPKKRRVFRDDSPLRFTPMIQAAVSSDAIGSATASLQARYAALYKTDQSILRKLPAEVKQLMKDLGTLNASQNTINSFLAFAPLPDDDSIPSDPGMASASARCVLTRAVEAANFMPDLFAQSLVLDIIKSSIQWQQAQNYIFLAEFLTRDLHKIADVIFDAHRRLEGLGDKTRHYADQHSAAFSTDYSSFASLVRHIVRYVRAAQSQKKNNRNKAKNRNSGKRSAPVLLDTEHEVDSLPPDLYGLLRGASSSRIPLAEIKGRPDSIQQVYKKAKTCFIDTIKEQLIYPYLREPTEDLLVDTSARKESLKDHLIIRGAVLQCLIDAFESESILASPTISPLIENPVKFFAQNLREPHRLALHITRDPDEALKPLREFLAEAVTDEAREAAEDIGDFINHHYLELERGRAVADDEYYRGILPDKGIGSSGRAGNRGLGDNIQLTADNILADDTSPHYDVLAVLLREGLNKRRGLDPAIESLSNCLSGLRPKDGRENIANFSDPDRWDPVRFENRTAKLLTLKIPPKKLTSPKGLSNLLTFAGTGQGVKTEGFLKLSNPTTSGGSHTFFSESVESCTKMFTSAIQKNLATLSSSHRSKVPSHVTYDDAAADEKYSKYRGMIQISNGGIYGTWNQWLSLRPTRRFRVVDGFSTRVELAKMSIPEKLKLYWNPAVDKAWVEFLGPGLKGKDPKKYKGILQTWGRGLSFINGLNIDGFKTGLTPLQTVNAMAFGSLIKSATLEEMAGWIWNNWTLGAFRGLQALGFVLLSYKAVLVALTVVYNHLDDHLGEADRKELGFDRFGVIVVEHLLCKVVRWKTGIVGMTDWVKEAVRVGSWKEDRSDFDAFPIPVSEVALERIERVLSEVQVRLSTHP